MVKSGLITGAVMFVLVLGGAAVISPFCALCAPVVAGLLAGYLAGVFEKPAPAELNKRAALAGTIGGAFGILAGMIAAVINAAVLQNPQYQVVNQALDLPTATPEMVWAVQLGLNCCIGLVNVGLTAGFALLGGLIWKNTAGKEQILPPDLPSE